MRVPVYQQQVTPQIPSVRSQVSVPDGAAGVAVKPIDTTAGIAQGVESLRLGLVKMQENRDKFMLASAVNEYRRSNTEFLHAKDTGLFAKKGKDVFGISQQYDEFSSKTMEDIAKRYKMSGAARDRFVEATSALYNASLSSVMQHEQRETDAAQQAEWKTMINDSLNAAALSPYDDAVCEENWKIMAGAIAQQNAPYGDKVVESKLAEGRSQHLMARLAPMLEDSPKAADAFLKAHNGELTGDDRLKARKAVDAKLDVIKVQEETDRIVKRFGGNEAAALKFVHAKFEGPMENHLASSVKSRYTELKIRSIGAASARAQAQNGMFKQINSLQSKGHIFTEDQIAGMQVTEEQRDRIRAQNEKNLEFASVWKNIPNIVPGGRDMNDDERYLYAARIVGISDAERNINVMNLAQGLEDGTKDADDIKLAQRCGDISPKDGKLLEKALQLMQSENAGVYTNTKKAVEKNIDLIIQENPILQAAGEEAKRQFFNYAAELKAYNNTGSFEKALALEASRVQLDLIDKQLIKQGRKVLEGTQSVRDMAQSVKDRNYGSSWRDPVNVAMAKKSGVAQIPVVTRSRAADIAKGGNSAALTAGRTDLDAALASRFPTETITGAQAKEASRKNLPFSVEIGKADPAQKSEAAASQQDTEGTTVKGRDVEITGSSGARSEGIKVSRPQRTGQKRPKEMTKEEIAAMAAEFGKRRFSGGDEKKGGGK